ncbi:MAG TPA: ABC transporter ATP-binding protein [Flavobacteriales bacterium]|nr:ABC transporter ATP-binding protein [Flavobacteriales bacterium]
MFENLRRLLRGNRRPNGETKQSWSSLKHLPPFLKLIWKTHPALAAANLALRIVKSLMPLALLLVGKLIVDEVILLIPQGSLQNSSHLWTLVAAEAALALVNELLNRLISLLDALLGDLFANSSSIRLMEHAANLDIEQFEDATFYDKLERARRQTLNRTVLMTQVLSQFQDVISLISLSAGLVIFNPWLILLLLVSVIPAFLGETHFNERSYSLVHGFTPERRELDYLRLTAASDETAKEVKLFGLSGFLIDRFQVLSDKYYQDNKRLSIQRASWGTILAAISTAGYYAAYVLILITTLAGSLSIGSLTFLSGSFARMRGLMETLLSRFASISQGALYLEDFYAFFELQPKIRKGEQSRPFPNPIREGFVFENVGFRYQNAASWALRNLNLHIRPGEKIALVGENGSGKTTLVKLIARLYDPVEGRILLDGHPLSEYNPDDLRREIGVIFQDFVKFQLTAGLNIATGNIQDKNNQEKIDHAASMSLADSVVSTLPKGYDQVIGRRFAEGVDLSGGQWQKIALGRVYMRNAQVLILDEPTAALDAKAEHEVFERFASLSKGKTAFIISHRFSTVRMADRILVLDKGELIESGSHEELMKTEGHYAALFKLQAAGYR